MGLWLAVMLLACDGRSAGDPPRIKAIAFDAFPVFDPRSIVATAEECYPGHGQELTQLWFRKLFEYQWLRALGKNYRNFTHATEASLSFAANRLDLPLSAVNKQRLLESFLKLEPWPDARAAIGKLRGLGYELVFLSNMTSEMLETNLEQSGLSQEFRYVISTDSIRTYKPAPEAYQLAEQKLGLSKDEILFVAFAGWDVAGAKWYGLPTFWVNRLHSPLEELEAQPDGHGADLRALIEFVTERNAKILKKSSLLEQ